MKAAELSLDKAKKAKAATIAAIELKMGELSTVSATLLDDQEYLKELASICEAQAKTWDQRSNMRADELGALTQAISIIKGTVSAKTTEKTIRFVQRQASLGAALGVTSSDDAMEAIEASAEQEDSNDEDSNTAFLQVQSSAKNFLRHVLQDPTSKDKTSEELDK